MKHNKGEVWKVSDRCGNMTICLLEDVDESKDMFFEAVIFSGKKDRSTILRRTPDYCWKEALLSP